MYDRGVGIMPGWFFAEHLVYGATLLVTPPLMRVFARLPTAEERRREEIRRVARTPRASRRVFHPVSLRPPGACVADGTLRAQHISCLRPQLTRSGPRSSNRRGSTILRRGSTAVA